MERWLLTVETNCTDPAREEEFNHWYDNVHLPDVLATPGIRRATRYENGNPGEGQAKFLAMYEVETEDIMQVMAALQENMSKWGEQGRLNDLMAIVSGSLYRQITPPVERK